MMIIETCPECGHDLQNLMLMTYPPIPQKKCFNCGWTWTGKQEEVMRVPFTEYLNCCDISDSTLTDPFVKENFENDSCANCSNNPKNGGSGICFCTLGSMQVTY